MYYITFSIGIIITQVFILKKKCYLCVEYTKKLNRAPTIR